MSHFAVTRVIAAALLVALSVAGGMPEARAEENCVSWGEARIAGLTEAFKLRPAPDIKEDVERRHGGKVVSFQICREHDALTYKLAVFRSDGKVLFVTEPAEPAAAFEAKRPDMSVLGGN